MAKSRNGYLFVKDLPPGRHSITKVSSHIRRSINQLGKPRKYEIPFTLKPGHVTILPKRFDIPAKSGLTRKHYEWHLLTEEGKQRIIEEHSNFKNFER